MLYKKTSYYQKYKEQQAGKEEEVERRLPFRIKETARIDFEAGKMILIDKPLHWTSFDVVKKIRTTLGIKKVGHAGTLDPLATGLLIVCTGKFTKLINTYMAAEKEYIGSFTLGAVTATYDRESVPEQHRDFSLISKDQMLQLLPAFIGTIQQRPPVYAAIKKEGTALYDLARRGEEVVPEPRTIQVSAFEITAIALPEVEFRLACSTGTYVRSIAHDFGAALGCGAYLSSLRRTRIGEYRVDEAQHLEQWLDAMEQLQ
jgi:tRNA pseudouridine55 synthase